MNKIINFFKFYLCVFLMFTNNIQTSDTIQSKSFFYRTAKNLKSFTPFINKYISLENSFLHLLIPILGVYGLFSAIEVLAMHFKIKLPPIIPVNDGGIPWWKIGLTTATLIIQPKWNFYKGLDSFRDTASPDSLVQDSINNLNAINNKYDSNTPTEKILHQKISLMAKDLTMFRKTIQQVEEEDK